MSVNVSVAVGKQSQGAEKFAYIIGHTKGEEDVTLGGKLRRNGIGLGKMSFPVHGRRWFAMPRKVKSTSQM